MRILLINSVCGTGSTGRIVTGLADTFVSQGDTVRIAYGRGGNIPDRFRENAIRIGNEFDVRVHGVMTRILDRHGLGSVRATRRFLSWADNYDPDFLWLHNIHGYYLNYQLLFRWIKNRPEMRVRWTLHDCWAFTGHCAYFSAYGCEKWKNRCGNCPLKHDYPESILLDRSAKNFEEKKEVFTDVGDMTLVVPSHWLERLVAQSFLQKYPIEVIPNEIDRESFCPRESDFRKRYGLQGKKLLLGVADPWSERKGLKDFLELSQTIGSEYRIVLVGLNERQTRMLPNNVLGLPRTDSAEKLAEIYTASDLYLNLSTEETFGMTVLEAAACGTKTICYQGTACEEVAKQHGGIAVERDPGKVRQEIEAYFGRGEMD